MSSSLFHAHRDTIRDAFSANRLIKNGHFSASASIKLP